MGSRSRRIGLALLAALVVALLALVLVLAGVLPVPPPADDAYERTTVAVYDEDGTRLGRVDARVADTWRERYVGLSATDRLAPDEGMLFTFEASSDRTFVMRGMDFGIDIVYVASDGTITSIHHAPEPPEGTDGSDQRYPGTGQYVLEVNRGWTTDHGVEVGDRVVIGAGADGATNASARSLHARSSSHSHTARVPRPVDDPTLVPRTSA
jgi:hypothetical protein